MKGRLPSDLHTDVSIGPAYRGFDLADLVQLEPHVEMTGDGAIDQLSGRHIQMNETGRAVLELLARGGRVGRIVELFASQFDVDHHTAKQDVAAVLTTLDAAALLRTRPSVPRRLHPALLGETAKRLLALEWFHPPARRYPPTTRGLFAATLRSARLTLVTAAAAATTLLGLLHLVARAPESLQGSVVVRDEIDRALTFAVLPLVLAVLLVLQIAAHEGAHLGCARRCGAAAFVVVRGLRIYVVHDETDPATGRLIALVGPLAGVGITLATLITLSLTAAPELLVVAVATTLVPHLWSALPWSSDGRIIWNASERPGPPAGTAR